MDKTLAIFGNLSYNRCPRYSQNFLDLCLFNCHVLSSGGPMEHNIIRKQLKTTLPKYLVNPSLESISLITKTKKLFAKNNEALYITNTTTGETTPATGGAAFIKEELVDTEQFIKLYAEGVKHLANLTAAGFKIFQLIYSLMIDNPNNDRLIIDFNDLSATGKFNQSQKTFIRGINELLEKEIIYQSVTQSVYFLNMNLFFNGERITKVQSYKLRKNQQFEENKPDLLSELEE